MWSVVVPDPAILTFAKSSRRERFHEYRCGGDRIDSVLAATSIPGKIFVLVS